jgi:hypothetical protein
MVQTGLRNYWCQLYHYLDYTARIQETFISTNTPPLKLIGKTFLNAGFKIFGLLVEGINTYGNLLGFTRFKKMITHVEEEGILVMYGCAKTFVKQCIERDLSLNSPESIEFQNIYPVLIAALNLLQHITNFPFLMTVGEYYSDNLVENLSPIVLPDSYTDDFFDEELVGSLKRIITIEIVSANDNRIDRTVKESLSNLSLLAAKILAKFPAVKRNAAHDETKIKRWTAALIPSFCLIADKSLSKFQTGQIMLI